MKKYILPLFLFVFLPFMTNSCAKTTDGQWMVYHETNCPPTWVNINNDRKSKNALEILLKADGIIPLKIRVNGERLDNCDDCYCETGKEYHVKVDKSQAGLLFYYGFELR
jgi:hypothetical protein